MPVFVRIMRIFFLVAICCGAAFADMHASRTASAAAVLASNAPDVRLSLESNPGGIAMPQLASLTPKPTNPSEDASSPAEPFDLPAMTARLGEMPAKWNDLQARILADEKTLAACRSGENPCSQAVGRFLSIIELGRQREGRAQLGWVNRAVNLSIRPVSDWAQYGFADYWASPLQTLSSGAGDCEDYAIVKYLALRELGIAPADLRLVIVRDNMRQTDHAVVAVRFEQEWLILDNRTFAVLNARQDQQYYPLFVLDYQGARAFSTATARR